MRKTRSLTCALVLGFMLLAGSMVSAQDTSGSHVGPADAALQSTPWYNAESKTLRPVVVREQIDDSVNRKSRWLPQPEKVAKNPSNNAASNAAGPTQTPTGLFGSDITFGNLFGYLLLALIVLSMVGLLVYVIAKAEIDLDGQSKSVSIRGTAPDEQTIERMKHLPAELRRTDVNMRSEAQRLMGLGQYDQAIILLFGHQLLLLDAAGFLRLTRGKTNGRYVRETRRADRDSGDCLRRTATAFERSYFGRHSIADSEMRALWSNNERLEQSVQSHQEAAA